MILTPKFFLFYHTLFTYYTIPPPARLAMFVRSFWVFEIENETPQPYVYRSMADGCVEFIFHYKGSFKELTEKDNISQSLSMIHAQSQKVRRFLTTENFGIFGAYLYPYAIPYLCSMPSSELSNEMPDLEMLYGSEGKALEENMMLAVNNTGRLRILTAFFEKKFLPHSGREPGMFACINHIIYSNGMVNVRKLSDKYFLSTRQFERKFKEHAGFAPKLYARIIRFQSARRTNFNKQKSLTEIAYDYGYYDQSHFIHDFKEFSGYQPKEFFYGHAEGSEFRNL